MQDNLSKANDAQGSDHLSIMDKQKFGKLALEKLSSKGTLPDNFHIYSAGWLGDKPEDFKIMEVKGMEYREAKSGPRKGQICIPICGTSRTVYLTKEELSNEIT